MKTLHTKVQIDDWWFEHDVANMKTAVHIADDPAKIEPRQLCVYTDDGHGNGYLIAKIDLEPEPRP